MRDDVERWRRETPGCLEHVHLNNAGAAMMPQPVVDAMVRHIHLEAECGGYEAAEARADAVADVYEQVARLIGARPRNIAVVENATVAFSQALAAFDFARGDRVVTTRNDYVANQLAFLALAERVGVEIVRAEDLPTGGVDVDDFRRRLRMQRCRVASITWMPTNSGLIQDAPAVATACREAAVPLIVDACQVVGQLPIDAPALGCDFLTGTARKFLRGPRGIGFLYVSDRALDEGRYPLTIDSQGATWTAPGQFELLPSARRFENWEFAYALVLGLGEAARYALANDVEKTGRRATELAAGLRAVLRALPGVTLLDRGTSLSAIVTARLEGQDARQVVAALRERGINASAALRKWALLDMDEKRADTALRLSPHYYNTEEEIALVTDALREVLRA